MSPKKAFVCLNILALVLALGAPAAAVGWPPVDPLLERHSNWFEPRKIYDTQADPYSRTHLPAGLTYKSYMAVGYNLANTILIVGPTGEIVVVDTLGDIGTAAKVLADARKLGYLPATGKLPIKAIIYTHNHIDHTAGVQAFLDAADRPACPPEKKADAGNDAPFDADKEEPRCVTVIGQENIVDSIANTATVIGTMINTRSAYMYGSFLIPDGVVNDGIGPSVEEGTSGFRMPSRTFSDQMDLTAAGVRMKLVYVPSETDDELAVFIPDRLNTTGAQAAASSDDGPGLLLSAEVIQGPSFPNLYSLRGTSYRNPAQWFRSVDVLRKWDSWCMLPAHGTPLCWQKNIQKVLRNFRDAIQFTHDQAIRWMNKGYTMEELPLQITMPEYLIEDLADVVPAKPTDTDPKDYLRAFYGSVSQAVRELYFGYLGWYQGDPVALAPTPGPEAAKRLVALMGGSGGVLDKAQKAAESGAMAEQQWAAELATIVLRAEPDNPRAKEIKATAYDLLATPQTNPNWRNWYLTSARELRGLTPRKAITGGLTSPDIVASLPAGIWVNSWTMRLQAEKTMPATPTGKGVEMSLGFWFPAPDQGYGGEGYVLNLRGAIAEFIETGTSQEAVKQADVAISLPKDVLDQIITADGGDGSGAQEALAKAVGDKRVQLLKGTPQQVQQFFSYFDRKPTTLPPLSNR
jgi:alkyl sulfatase BDS1-like metallo-beta-lactamase superfamily hydrolase